MNTLYYGKIQAMRPIRRRYTGGNMQKFIAREKHTFSNGAIGWRPGGPFDCLGPYAKVEHCPIHGTNLTRTCYATGYADTFFSVPAVCKVHGKRIKGFFTGDDGACVFLPMAVHHAFLAEVDTPVQLKDVRQEENQEKDA